MIRFGWKGLVNGKNRTRPSQIVFFKFKATKNRFKMTHFTVE